MASIPTGTTTFLFTDIEGSTALWERNPGAMAKSLELHDEVMQSTAAIAEGYVFTTAGDSFAIAFSSTAKAIEAAIEIQRQLRATNFPAGAEIRVRMGLHVGEAQERGGDYFGVDVIRAARIMSAAHGGQILASQALVAMTPGQPSRVVGDLELHGLTGAEQVSQLLAEGLPDRFPPLRKAAAKTNLPASPDRLLGRLSEIDETVRLLSDHRLVSVVGPGGIGKTRVATEAASRLSARFSDGVWFVDLSGVATGEEVGPAIGSTLGIQTASTPTVEAVAHAAGQLEVLIVLDNCEHVIDDSARFTEALLLAPSGRVLTTSRERLDIRGEVVIRLQSLDLGADASAQNLFLDRAEQAGFAIDGLSDDERTAVTRICQSLDGLPLALELAASRLATMNLSELERRLASRYHVLRRRGRTSHRHEALLSTVEWSHELLGSSEQAVFNTVSIMAGSFSAAEVVPLFPHADEFEVLDALDALTEASLIEPQPGGRLRLLESMRAFGRLNLDRGGTLGEIEKRHTDLVLRRLEATATKLYSANEVQAWSELSDQLPDLRSVVHRSISTGDPGPGCVILAQLVELQFNGGLSEAFAWAADLASCEGLDADPNAAAVYATAGFGALAQTNDAELVGWIDRARALDAQPGYELSMTVDNLETCLNILRGNHSVASDRYQAMAKRAIARDDNRRAAFYLGSAAFQLSMDRRHQEAQPFAEQALEFAFTTDNPSTIAWCHYQMALARVDHNAEHIVHLRRCVEVSDGAVPSGVFDNALCRLADLEAAAGADTELVYRLSSSALKDSLRAGRLIWFWHVLARTINTLERLGADSAAAEILGCIEHCPVATSPTIASILVRNRQALAARLRQPTLDQLATTGKNLTPSQATDLALDTLWNLTEN